MAKKNYWLKLQRGFFKRHDIRILEASENGPVKALFYLKLLLESIDHDGYLRFSKDVPYTVEDLSIITDTDIETAEDTFNYLLDKKMLEILEDGTIHLTKLSDMVGSETDWAEKKREYRKDSYETKDGQSEDNVRTMSGLKKTMSDKSKSKSKSKIKNKTSRETPAAVPSAPSSKEVIRSGPKDLSKLKDTLADYYQGALTSIQPAETWGDFGKERSQCNILARKTRALLPKVPYTTDQDLASAVISHYMRMKEYGTDKRIRSSPVIPSRLSQFWPEIIASLADEYESQQSAAEMEDILF